MNVENGVRASTAYAYKKHVVNKKWLTIIGNAHVSRLLINKGNVTGVEGRGWVKLRSKNPSDAPRILCNF